MDTKNTNDTIVALATPPGNGAISIIRLSGPNSREYFSQVCSGLEQKKRSRFLYFERLVSEKNEILDEVLWAQMPGPNSYTGEDVLEIYCHGGEISANRIISTLISVGARPAEPGEFTKRAFFNGRIDLTRAEAVADTIAARSVAAHRLAQRHLSGELERLVSDLRNELLELISLIEGAIDFSLEPDVFQVPISQIKESLLKILDVTEPLEQSVQVGQLLKQGLQVVIVGQPNSGKSSLFNRLLGNRRAIVTSVPGTTRDFIEEELILSELSLRITDTAGLRATGDLVELEGIRRTRNLTKEADVVLWLLDQFVEQTVEQITISVDELEDFKFFKSLKKPVIIPLLSKADLQDSPPAVTLKSKEPKDLERFLYTNTLLRISSVTGEGVEHLLEAIKEIIRELTLGVGGEGVTITRERHRHAFAQCNKALRRAQKTCNKGLSYEFIALDMRLAADNLGEIVGEITTDELLNRIFSTFCVGK